MCSKRLACKVVCVFSLFKSAVSKSTADDTAQLNPLPVFSFNFMSARVRVADNNLFSYSRLACLKPDFLI